MSKIKFLLLTILGAILVFKSGHIYIGVANHFATSDSHIEMIGMGMVAFNTVLYALMIYAAYKRGKSIGKEYLYGLPCLAAAFGLILVFVPYSAWISLVLCALAAILGLSVNKNPIEDTSTPDEKDEDKINYL